MDAEQPDTIPILYRDRHLVVVAKPARLLVHRSHIAREQDVLLQRLRRQLGQRINPVHRLDRPTSGVLIFAFSSAATRAMQALFDADAVEKCYLALVRGWCDDAGVVDTPLKKHADGPERPARTDYRCLRRVEMGYPAGPYATTRYALVAAWPRTGRLHQIRRHFNAMSHPIIGDTTHGDGRQNRAFREHIGVHRLMLHARVVRFPHPMEDGSLCVRAPVPGEMAAALAALGWPDPADGRTRTSPGVQPG